MAEETKAYPNDQLWHTGEGRGVRHNRTQGPNGLLVHRKQRVSECTWGETRVVGDSPDAPNPLTCTRSCCLARSHSEHVPRHVSTVDPVGDWTKRRTCISMNFLRTLL